MLKGMQRDGVGWEGRFEGVEEMLQHTRGAASTAFAQMRWMVGKVSQVSLLVLILSSLSLVFSSLSLWTREFS
jgi:hypothetical protein